MKHIAIAVLMLFAMPVIAAEAPDPIYTPPPPLCTTEMNFIIRDANGNVMDQTTYNRNFPLDCTTTVLYKYKWLLRTVEHGKAAVERLTGVDME